MLIRFRFALLIALAAGAIYVGLYPSLLTLGALLGVPLAVLGAVGLAAPGVVLRRPRLSRFALAGGGVLGTELALLAAGIAWTPRRPVTLIVTPPVPARVRVVYGVADGAPRRWWRWGRQFEVPSDGLLRTRYAADDGWYRPGNRHPVRVVVRGPGARVDTLPGAWVDGGTTRAGTCELAYDEFAIGSAPRPAAHDFGEAGSPGWLDSLGTWGVACRGGRVVRAAAGTTPALERTAPACYYGEDGGISCGSAPRAP